MILLIHLVNDGCGTAEGLVSEEYRGHGLHSAETVMVDDLTDVRVLHTFNCLTLLIVVNKDDALSFRS